MNARASTKASKGSSGATMARGRAASRNARKMRPGSAANGTGRPTGPRHSNQSPCRNPRGSKRNRRIFPVRKAGLERGAISATIAENAASARERRARRAGKTRLAKCRLRSPRRPSPSRRRNRDARSAGIAAHLPRKPCLGRPSFLPFREARARIAVASGVGIAGRRPRAIRHPGRRSPRRCRPRRCHPPAQSACRKPAACRNCLRRLAHHGLDPVRAAMLAAPDRSTRSSAAVVSGSRKAAGAP